MSELIGDNIDQRIETEFDAFSEVLADTDGESLYEFFDADIMANPSLPALCQRLLKYAETSGTDSAFGIEAGINFAVTMTELAAYRTDRALDILSEIIAGYERQDYAQAQRCLNQAVDSYFEASPTLDGFTQAYLLTDIDDFADANLPDTLTDPVKIASRLAAGMMFMAIEELAVSEEIPAGLDSALLQG